MDQKEFNKYKKKMHAAVESKLQDYDNTMSRVRNKEIHDWGHSDWLNLVWTSKAYIEGMEEALIILAKQSKLEYKALDMKEIDDRLL